MAGLVAEDAQGVAVRVAALDTLCTLLGLLGEVLPEALPSLQQPIQHQLISSHGCLRLQVLQLLHCHALQMVYVPNPDVVDDSWDPILAMQQCHGSARTDADFALCL